MDAPICEESVTIPNGALRLSGVLAYPETGAARFAALLCAPHPNFAGNMENNVIQALARDFARDAMTLRFDYRGIGASQSHLSDDVSVFDYWNQVEETQNYSDPFADALAAAAALCEFSSGLPLAIVGYSFGSIIGLRLEKHVTSLRAIAGIAPPLTRYDFSFLSKCRTPCLLLSGRDDFVLPTDGNADIQKSWPTCVTQTILDGHDHFFRGTEETVCHQVRTFVEKALSGAQT